MDHKENNLQEQMAKSAAKLDAAESSTPEFAYFKGLVGRQQARLRRSQRIQLALFILVAVLVVSALMLCIGRAEAFFIALQGAAVAVAVISLAVSLAKKPKEAVK